MARLPSDIDLGGSPSANSGRPIATFDITGYARGAAALAGGVSDIGKGVQSASKDIAAANLQETNQASALEEAQANSNRLIKTGQLQEEASKATDPSTLEATYTPKFKEVFDESAAMISDPRKRELWIANNAPKLEGQRLAVADHAYNLRKTGQIASSYDELDNIRNLGLRASDPAAKEEYIAAGNELISGLKTAGYIDAVAEQKLRKGWTTSYAIGALEAMPPEERVKALSSVVQGKDAVLDRIGQVENATGNPAARASTSSAMGNFQFTNGTWLDMVRAHRPDLMQGRDPQAVLDLRADPKVSREMAGYLIDDNAAVLRNQGITPTPSNLYLAHFLGVNDAAKVIKAAPGTPLSDVVSPASIAANKSVLQGKTTDTVLDWSGRKMGGTANQPLQFDNYSLPGKEANLIEYHRDNLRNGTYVENNGDISTVYITGVTGPDGKIYNVPGYWDGKLHTDVKEITDHAAELGWDKWPSYANGKQADAAAERDHKIVDADTVKFRSQQKTRSGGLADFIPEDKRVEMLHTAQQEAEGGSIQQQRQAKLQAQAAKDASDARENEVLQDLYSPTPKLNVQSIASDPSLTPAAKERMIAAAGRALADTKADKTYGHGFFDAYQKVHAPDGTPGKITDPSVLYSRVGPDGDLTVAGVDKLVSEINARKTPEGVAETAYKKAFFDNAYTQLAGTDPMTKMKDPKGDEIYLKFLAQAMPAYDAGRKAGKSPVQMLNPDSPDYIGKSIDGMKRPLNVWMKDVLDASPELNTAHPDHGAPAFDVKAVNSLNELIEAYRSRKINKAVASEIAMQRGWVAPNPAPVSAPVSQ